MVSLSPRLTPQNIMVFPQTWRGSRWRPFVVPRGSRGFSCYCTLCPSFTCDVVSGSSDLCTTVTYHGFPPRHPKPRYQAGIRLAPRAGRPVCVSVRLVYLFLPRPPVQPQWLYSGRSPETYLFQRMSLPWLVEVFIRKPLRAFLLSQHEIHSPPWDLVPRPLSSLTPPVYLLLGRQASHAALG